MQGLCVTETRMIIYYFTGLCKVVLVVDDRLSHRGNMVSRTLDRLSSGIMQGSSVTETKITD